ncbi:hypothetical protein IMCC9480_1308 [Oxalobacteraceae bacterium IMCC9480]|nr:hypothetical protein IMCC9480_1308 [Oxalobacteraceae bacterium IMCC9480]
MICERHVRNAYHHRLSFAKHVHEFNDSQDVFDGPKELKI